MRGNKCICLRGKNIRIYVCMCVFFLFHSYADAYFIIISKLGMYNEVCSSSYLQWLCFQCYWYVIIYKALWPLYIHCEMELLMIQHDLLCPVEWFLRYSKDKEVKQSQLLCQLRFLAPFWLIRLLAYIDLILISVKI